MVILALAVALVGVGVAVIVRSLGTGTPGGGEPARGGSRHRPAADMGGPLTITVGGTYRGAWRSDNPRVPAVLVATPDPIRIVDSELAGAGALITTGVPHAKIDVENSRGIALYPGGRGIAPGRFLDAEGFDSVTVEGNELRGTSGIRLLDWAGGPGRNDAVRILRNRALEIDGRLTDGTGGFSRSRWEPAQFVQLDKVIGAPAMEIAWNEVTNTPGRGRVEDNISVYLSSGTRQAPLLIHDNYIQGGYPGGPRDDYGGGGIMLGDGGSDARGTRAPAWVRAFDNQVVGTTNYGLAIAAGHDLVMYGNRAVASGLLPDGTRLAATNVGLYIANLYRVPGFTGNAAYGNTVAWYRPGGGMRNDWWLPGCAQPRCDNMALSPGGTVSLRDEAAERVRWERKVISAGIHVGPV
ncbi:MAG: hypothetical protein ACQSGP_23030 [Frankia sp.]